MMIQPTTRVPHSEEFSVSTDRSSESPSNVDDLMEDDVNHKEEEDEEEISISQRVSKLEHNFIYIQHQLSSIMTHLHATPCECSTCGKVSTPEKQVDYKDYKDYKLQFLLQTDASEMLSQLFPNASSQQLKTLLDLSKMNKLPNKVVVKQENGGAANQQDQKDERLGQGYTGNGHGGKIHTERHSEPGRKIRKFGFPVSTYYQRKENVPSAPLAPTVSANTSTASPGPSSSEGSGDDHNEVQMDTVAAQSVPATPTTPGANLFTQSMVDMLKLNAAQQNAAHSTGSPGFLRGRGRGRPKLIGDELDADLVDYMVSLKNSDPHGGHFTASQALHMARQYILERAPGLLEEHGGHVKLKLTWAMKLVSRIGERQKEIELGLPAGTLSNMGRNLTNLPPGGNFMADMMAQNIFSQHMMMVNQQLGGGSPTGEMKNGVKQENQNEENLNGKAKDASQMPEIVNIKELNIPFLNNFLAELNDNNAGLIDGEIGSTVAAALFAPNA
uniref:HTH CENPB-type domain-containing protein n=1 Tax=Caenorhabditis tropicalis TaxID=1561998 RepID=A0A1I7THX8_9PELO